MLSFITLASSQAKTLPKVSYIKASEIWFLACTGFIFSALVEFAFVNTIWRRKYVLYVILPLSMIRKIDSERLLSQVACKETFINFELIKKFTLAKSM